MLTRIINFITARLSRPEAAPVPVPSTNGRTWDHGCTRGVDEADLAARLAAAQRLMQVRSHSPYCRPGAYPRLQVTSDVNPFAVAILQAVEHSGMCWPTPSQDLRSAHLCSVVLLILCPVLICSKRRG